MTGRGVIVAILDRGIDWRHPDFIREDGTTRILAILDQSGQSYCQSSNPSALEFDRADIQAALDTGADLGTRDAVGHGTATAGLAAGNGRAFANGKYRGIAPEADLLIVKMASEGAPAHGGHAAESPFVACIDEALDWVDAKIDELGQPCVALINSGTQWGPIDGTSAVSRKIEEVFGEDRPGRVCVLPSGDEGSLPNHARTSFAPGAPAVFKFVKADTTAVFTQLWFTGDAPAEVLVKFTSGASSGPVAPGGFAFTDGIQIRHYLPGTEGYPWLSTNGERSVRIWITGQSGPGSIRVRSLGADGGTVDAYGDLAGPNLTSILRFQDHLTPGRLTDYASTRSAIIVGNEVLRTQWKSITGATIPAAGEGQVGQLWTKSSAGPTRDGRLLAVDLTAPGQNVFAAYGQDSYWTTFDDVLVQDGGRWYGRLAGTSGSAPIVTAKSA